MLHRASHKQVLQCTLLQVNSHQHLRSTSVHLIVVGVHLGGHLVLVLHHPGHAELESVFLNVEETDLVSVRCGEGEGSCTRPCSEQGAGVAVCV